MITSCNDQSGSFPATSCAPARAGAPRQRVVWATGIVTALALLFVAPALTHAQTNPNDQVAPMASTDLKIDKATLHIRIAATPEQEERGLMFVTKMPDNDGMIFILPLGRAEFWMKNTLIPLSVAFIDKNGVILEIHDMQPGDPNVPDAQLPRTKSDSDLVQYALETNLHWFALNGIKPGDKIDLLAVEKADLDHELQQAGHPAH